MSDGYRPLPHNVTISESNIEGLGAHATEAIPAGTILGITHYNLRKHGIGLIRTPLGGFLNHSDRPNCVKTEIVEGVWELSAAKDIWPGDELTVSYTLVNPPKGA